jgi:hypothetical protein
VELVTESAICRKCRVEVREGSVFCYNCGARITAEAGPGRGQVSNGRSGPIPAVPPAAPADGQRLEPVEDKPMSSLPPDKHSAALPTAASMRRSRPRSPRAVEVVWQERQGPGWGFVIGSSVLVMIAITLLLLSLYLR